MYENTDDIKQSRYVDKNWILSKISEQDIFSLVFGFKPTAYQHVTSPFRVDKHAGCWFEYTNDGKLWFVDFASPFNVNIDCFEAVKRFYKLRDFYDTLVFIYNTLIKGKEIEYIDYIKPIVSVKKQVVIQIKPKEFTKEELKFWIQYGINYNQLKTDKVYSVDQLFLYNTKYGNSCNTYTDPVFAFTDFPNGRKKIYRPFKINGNGKWLSNCQRNDIGNIEQLINKGDKLIITKSYKDCRILRNIGYNSIWTQNEGAVPSCEQIVELCERFTNIIIFFDNDEKGISESLKLTSIFNNIKSDIAKSFYLHDSLLNIGIKDTADFYLHEGKRNLINVLKNSI